ncbi:OmpW family protein [Alcanivorax hongdengensis A-11-3]|uniref:OmpW family protein n=1 Tax=Alcanivorax hongdengensis A-11-3 TaxID=1177179 RepID=L0W8A5_9GAMM|nr:OmpW family outer membrane protein [Alcanivorax hongdengensis]EKF73146.1 OmpW family protein [Alcanivorax hongdengensis A-11-3]
MKILRPTLLAVCVAMVSGHALAYQADDVIARFGPAVVAPDGDSSSALGDIADVDDGYSAGISATYMINDLFGLEVLGALPFKHDIHGSGALDGVEIGSTWQLPPTLLLQFAPPVSESFQPYVGLGYNYTFFFDEKTDGELDTALGAPTSLSLSDSSGIAYEVGVDVPIRDRWMFNASVWHIDIDTTADVKAAGSTAAKVDVTIDPWVYMVGLGVKF